MGGVLHPSPHKFLFSAGGIKPARKAAQISSAQKNERTDSPSKSHLKPDANEFKPSNLKKTSNPNFKSEGNNSVRAQSSQSNRVDLKAKQNPIKSLKADAPAFQPRPSGKTSKNLQTQFIIFVSKLLKYFKAL